MTPRAFSSRQVERRFRSAVVALHLPSPTTIVAAISGGPDSSALLLLLTRFAAEFRFHLVAGYCDHRIRPPDECAAEAATVRRLTECLGVPLQLGAVPVPDLARLSRRSLEEEARVQRYRFLAGVAAEHGAWAVAAGHTADDQAETVLLHILRGSGVRGLIGMTADSDWPLGEGPRLVRPLLGHSRAETEAYCQARGFEPFHDSSNASTAFVRNRLRLETLPLLRELNPRVDEALLRLAASAAGCVAALEGRTSTLPDPAVDRDGRGLSLPLASLMERPEGSRVESLACAYERLRGSRRDLTSCHLTALGDLVSGTTGRSVDLPGRVTASRTRSELRLAIGRPREASPLPETRIHVPGRTRIGDWEIEATALPAGAVAVHSPFHACIEAGELPFPLIARSRRAGDRMRPSGMEGSKKLQDLFVDAGIVRGERAGVPVVCLNGEIIWVVGLRRSSRADVRSTERDRILLTAHRLDLTRAPD